METLTKERERLKELEIRWKAVCSKKEKVMTRLKCPGFPPDF
jgi:hypothetical protein